MMLPKPNVKAERRAKKQARSKRRQEMHSYVHQRDRKCRAFWLVDSDYLPDNTLEVCHIIPKRPNAPELDEGWNVVLLRRFVHRMFDGKDPNPLGLTARQYKIYCLKIWKKVDGEKFEHHRALKHLLSKEAE